VSRAQAIEIGFTQEFGVLHLQEQLFRLHSGIERHADVTLDHLGIDELDTHVTCHRNPVIPVFYEIDIAHFVELDRRQGDILEVEAVDCFPAAGGVVLPR